MPISRRHKFSRQCNSKPAARGSRPGDIDHPKACPGNVWHVRSAAQATITENGESLGGAGVTAGSPDTEVDVVGQATIAKSKTGASVPESDWLHFLR